MRINPYLSFNGDCKAAFELYAKTFGGRIDAMFTHADAPTADEVPAPMRNQIMHAQLSVGDQVIMGADCPAQYREKPQGFSVSLHVDSIDEAERIYAVLSEGGTVSMAIGETFWALRFAMVTDRFGIPWAINCQRPEEK